LLGRPAPLAHHDDLTQEISAEQLIA